VILAPLPAVLALASPLTTPPWRHTNGPIVGLVAEALAEDDLWPMPVEPDAPKSVHVARIAWFVRKGWDDPIQIDLGCPSFPGWRPTWPITDGNHRLAAAEYRDDAEILLEWGGEVALARRVFGATLIDAEPREIAKASE
jgi:hypothetical protein